MSKELTTDLLKKHGFTSGQRAPGTVKGVDEVTLSRPWPKTEGGDAKAAAREAGAATLALVQEAGYRVLAVREFASVAGTSVIVDVAVDKPAAEAAQPAKKKDA